MHEDTVISILKDAGIVIRGKVQLPPRNVSFSPVPKTVHPILSQSLRKDYPNGLYSHQSMALEASSEGKDLCLATSTASGKSMVFMAAATNELCHKPTSRILALYPARALLQDQYEKWTNFSRALLNISLS